MLYYNVQDEVLLIEAYTFFLEVVHLQLDSNLYLNSCTYLQYLEEGDVELGKRFACFEGEIIYLFKILRSLSILRWGN